MTTHLESEVGGQGIEFSQDPRSPSYSLLARPLASCVLEDPDSPPSKIDLHTALEPLRSWIKSSIESAHRKITLSTAELVERLRQSARENLDRLEDDPERAIRAEYGFLQFIEKVLTSPPTTIAVLAITLDQPPEQVRDWIRDIPANPHTHQIGKMLLAYVRDLCAEPESASDEIPGRPLSRFEDLLYLGNLRKAFETLYEASPPKPAQAEYLPPAIGWLHDRQSKLAETPGAPSDIGAIERSSGDLLLVAPTNGGKNGIILALALAAVAHDRGPVVVLQPYRAQISESRRSWQDAVAGRPVKRRGVTRGVEIAGSSALISSSDYRISRGRIDVTAIIPEKLAVLTRNRGLRDFCRLLIVDEISHLIDPERGAKLEIILTLARASAIPVFATGAGLATTTAESVARWLGNLEPSDDPRVRGALLHNPQLRRDPPLEYCVWRRDGERRFWRYGASLAEQQVDATDPIDEEILEDAVAEVVYRELRLDPNRQVLVFLEDREGVLEIADSIASKLRADVALTERMTELAPKNEAASLAEIWLGGNLPSKVDIPQILQSRVGVHTRDIPSNNIENIEAAFRQGTLRVLCATRTVEAGINLPVDTVVQVGLLDFNRRPLPQRMLDQRLGRSGRTLKRQHTSGRGIIYIHDTTHGIERVIPTRLLQEDPPTGSQMNEEYLALLLLTSMGDHVEKTRSELEVLLQCSYWAKEQPTHNVQAMFRAAITNLQQKRLVETNKDGLLSATPLGQAIASALLTPRDAPAIANVRETASLAPRDESWLVEVLLAACQVPSIAEANRRPREQDVIVRPPLSRTQILKAWCRERADGRLEFGIPGGGSFSVVAGTQLSMLLERVRKETASPSELRSLLRAYVATAWTLGRPVEFPRHIRNLNDYIVGQDLGYYLAHIIRAAAWLAHYESRFLLNLRLSELAQQVDIGVAAEALPFMEVCADHVKRSKIRELQTLQYENLLADLPEKLAQDLTARMDFLRRRMRDREERLALDDGVFQSREELVGLQRALTAPEVANGLRELWHREDKDHEDEIVVVDRRTIELYGIRLRVMPTLPAPEDSAFDDVDLLMFPARLDAAMQRSRARQQTTILGSEEFLVLAALCSSLPTGQRILLLKALARINRVARRDVLRALFAEIAGSGRYSMLEQEYPTTLTLNTATLRLQRDMQLIYSDMSTPPQVTPSLLVTDPGTQEKLRERVLESSEELLDTIEPLLRQRRSIVRDAENRGVPLPEAVQIVIDELMVRSARIREIKRHATESPRLEELEGFEVELIESLEAISKWS